MLPFPPARARLSLYEQRLNRTLVQAKAELKQLQQEHAEAERDALLTAAQRTAPGTGPSGPNFRELPLRRAALWAESGEIRNLKQALNQPWQPEQHGFEFSLYELTLWMERRQLQGISRRLQISRLAARNRRPEFPSVGSFS